VAYGSGTTWNTNCKPIMLLKSSHVTWSGIDVTWIILHLFSCCMGGETGVSTASMYANIPSVHVSVNLLSRHNIQGLVYMHLCMYMPSKCYKAFLSNLLFRSAIQPSTTLLVMWDCSMTGLLVCTSSRTYWCRWKLISMIIIYAVLVYRQTGDVWTQQAAGLQQCSQVSR